MRIKKILSLAVVLAMVLTVVPMFGISASAAEPEHNSDYYVQLAVESGYVFEGTTSNEGIEANARSFNDDDIKNTTWNGWSSNNENKLRPYNYGGSLFIAPDANTDASGNTTYVLTASEDVQTKTAGKDFIVVEWANNDWGGWMDIGYVDTEGKMFDSFRYTNKSADNGIHATYPTTGWPASNNTDSAYYKLFGDAINYQLDESGQISAGTTADKAPYRMVYVKDSDDDGYTASYYYYNGSDYTWVTTKTYETGSFNGFKQIVFGYIESDSRIHGLKIYAGNFPIDSTEATVKAALDNISVVSMTAGKKIDLLTQTQDEFDTDITVDWQSDKPEVIGADGTVTQTDEVETVTLTPSATVAGVSAEPIVGASHTVTVFPKPLADTTYVTKEKKYTVDSTSLINDFSDLEGWTDGKGTGVNTSNGISVLTEGDVTYLRTNYDHSSSNDNGSSSIRALKKTVAGLEKGKTYLIAVTMKGGTASWIGLDFGGEKESVDNNNNSIFPSGTISDWTRVSAVFTANSTELKILSRWNDANYERFELYSLEEAEAAVPTKVTTTVEGQTYTLYEGNVFAGETETANIPERSFYYNGKIYKVAAQEVALTSTEAEKTVEANVAQEYAATNVAHDPASPAAKTTVGEYVGVAGGPQSSDIKDDDGASLINGVTALGNSRYVDMTFNMPTLSEGQVAILHIAAGGADDNNGSNKGTIRIRADYDSSVYAYSTSWQDNASNRTDVYSTPIYGTVDITDIVKAANAKENEEFSIKFATSGGIVGLVDQNQCTFNGVAEGYASYIEIVDGVKVTVENAEGNLITKNGTKMTGTEFYALEGDTVRVYNGAENTTGLAVVTSEGGEVADNTVTTVGADATTIKVVPTPAAPTVELAWVDGDFVIAVTPADDAEGVAITPQNGELVFQAVEEGNDAVAIKTGATNRWYEISSANAKGAVKSAEPVKESIYSLVVKEILSGKYTGDEALSEARIKKASEVITRGGYLSEVTSAEIMTKAEDSETYTIQEAATKLGIGFVYYDGVIGIGSEDVTIGETADGTYDTLTVEGGSATLSNSEGSVFTAEAITLSLDAVNIEFIESLIEETETAGADAQVDMVPEI